MNAMVRIKLRPMDHSKFLLFTSAKAAQEWVSRHIPDNLHEDEFCYISNDVDDDVFNAGKEIDDLVQLHRTPPAPGPCIIITRPMDEPNIWHITDEVPGMQVIDIDLGYMDLKDPAELEDWTKNTIETAEGLERDGYLEAAREVRRIVAYTIEHGPS